MSSSVLSTLEAMSGNPHSHHQRGKEDQTQSLRKVHCSAGAGISELGGEEPKNWDLWGGGDGWC